MAREAETRATISRVQRRYPDAVALATLASPAVVIEPELLRRIRLAAAPQLSVGAEADLWFSRLVRTRNAAGIALDPSVAAVLRERLRLWVSGNETLVLTGGRSRTRARAAAERAWAEIARRHEHHEDVLSPALALEERLAWLVITGQPTAAIEQELSRALATFQADGDEGVAWWAAQALPRLPGRARNTRTAATLDQLAAWATAGRSLTLTESATDVDVVDLDALLASAASIRIGVRREGDTLELGLLAAPTAALEVPDTHPRLVTVVRGEGPGETEELIAIPDGEARTLRVGSEAVRLENAAGEVFHVPLLSPARDARQTDPERVRMEEARGGRVPWKSWGPYLSERQWGTVREDYSANGDAWGYLPHDQARSRAYRWGEDGIAGICDDGQRLCLAVALWNGVDPILKERMFGLTGSEGNHGEDVKEYWFHVDNTPTHSYMKYQYKYPQRPFPYEDLQVVNRLRGRQEPEYELLDTGIFDDDRYFDVVVEYAKAAPTDIVMLVTAYNRGPEPATLQVLPTLWFRNTWAWGDEIPRPEISAVDGLTGLTAARTTHSELDDWLLQADGSATLLFTENETNHERLFGATNASPYVKDGINDYVVTGWKDAVNPGRTGTKLAAQHVLEIAAGDSASVRVRLTASAASGAVPSALEPLGADFDRVLHARRDDADRFYATLTPVGLSPESAAVMRQALAGLLWGKQYYEYDVQRWLREHGVDPSDPSSADRGERNLRWAHLQAADVISMPDTWEYPWFSAWGLALQCAPLSLVDIDLAKDQLQLLLGPRYMRTDGQIPAYEWNFSDVTPPATAWGALWIYEREADLRGDGDRAFLARVFERLMTNFTWWANRRDPDGRSVFEGGFLSLDSTANTFEHSAPPPDGGTLESAGSAIWMALHCLWMIQIAAELAKRDPDYIAKMLELVSSFLSIAVAMSPPGSDTALWDEQDGLYYDVLRMPGGQAARLKVRSQVGLLALCAATVFPHELFDDRPDLLKRLSSAAARFSDTLPQVSQLLDPNADQDRMLSLVDEPRLRRILSVMLDEDEFLGPHGIRSMSRRHLDQPVVFQRAGREYKVQYVPGESDTGLFGGNSNWRGPVWFPFNLLIIRGLIQLHSYYGDRVKVECPTGSGRQLSLLEVAREIGSRLAATFLEDNAGRRPAFGNREKFQTDPYWHNLLLFHEYFDGDTGAGLGASHQTGWTAGVAVLLAMADGDHLTG